MTPAMSLSRSQRETWTSTGSSGPGRPSPVMTADLVTVPTSPSRRVNVGGTAGAAVSTTPSCATMAETVSASSSWFFGANGSIDGGMIQTFAAGIHGGTYSRRENT